MKKKMIFILSVLMLVVGSASAELRLHYDFEALPAVDSTGITTAIVRGTGLALDSDVPIFDTGSSKSMSFDGSSWLILANTASATEPLLGRPGGTENHDMTVALWMKAGTTDSRANVLSDYGTGRRIQLESSGSGLRVWVHDVEYGIIPDVFDDKWHHIAIVVDQNQDGDNSEGVKVYKDAVLEIDAPTAGVSWFNIAAGCCVGAIGPTGTKLYTGLMDDFRIYTDELWTQAQIENLMASPVATTDVGDGVEVT